MGFTFLVLWIEVDVEPLFTDMRAEYRLHFSNNMYGYMYRTHAKSVYVSISVIFVSTFFCSCKQVSV